MRLFNPWPEPYRINARSPFGPRRHPITGKQSFHHGVDVAMPTGTPLIAGADGTIAHKGNGASGGHVLIIRHAGNFHSVYYHLKEASHKHVGQQVKAGDHVATSGNTGASTGPHLHFEVRRSRRWGDTENPENFLQGPYRQRPTQTDTRPDRRARNLRPSRRRHRHHTLRNLRIIIPLDRLDRMGGGDIYITVNAGMGTNGPQVGEEIVAAIKRYERTSGRVFQSA